MFACVYRLWLSLCLVLPTYLPVGEGVGLHVTAVNTPHVVLRVMAASNQRLELLRSGELKSLSGVQPLGHSKLTLNEVLTQAA